jgi:hypothetical protein
MKRRIGDRRQMPIQKSGGSLAMFRRVLEGSAKNLSHSVVRGAGGCRYGNTERQDLGGRHREPEGKRRDVIPLD